VSEVNLIIAGRAGQGLQVISRTFGQMLVRHGFHVFVSQDVMSRIRGGHNFARVRVSTEPVAADGDKAQVLVALDPALVARHLPDLAEDAVVVADAAEGLPEGVNAIRIPFLELAREQGGTPVMVNAAAVGATLALVGLEPAGLNEMFESQFGHKGGDVVKRNVAAAEAGYKAVVEEQKRCCPHRLQRTEDGGRRTKDELRRTKDEGRKSGRVVVSGAEALALGAIAAGVRVVTGYPMSPATPIVEYCFRHAEEAGLIVEQTEDEVSAANLAIGAAFAGARAMACTAGGGFCLMNEALSLDGMTEVPLVLCVGMRPGPATGMATRTAQADLLFSIYAGHGDFQRAVLTPADASQAFQAAQDAFRIAEKYQTPAIILFDQFMADALWTVEAESLKPKVQSAESKAASSEELQPYSYRRYEVTENGVSPMLCPGTPKQLVYADSDEHNEEGHITESAAMRVLMVNKRNAKLVGIRQELEGQRAETEVKAEAEKEMLVFCFGSARGAVAEATARLRGKGHKVAMVHLKHVWPFPAEAVLGFVGTGRKLVTVEQNYSGQLAKLLLQECGLRVAGTVRRYDGRQFTVAEVEAGVRGTMNDER
jgi:2-oxoglutarate ferredoxin oxidoreductase subunit alpha